MGGHERDRTPTLRGLLRDAWNTLHTIYYANSVSWRVLKSGALFFFGFFLWAGSNVILSVQPAWTVLHFAMSYGFVLIFYGPFHHAVVIPVALRWRRAGGRKTRIGRRLPNASLVIFLAIVLVLGMYPIGPVSAEFGGDGGGGGFDINPDLLCTKHTAANGSAEIHCHLTEATGISYIEVSSGSTTIATDREPPFEFTVRDSELVERNGQRRFRVALRDDSGALIRQFTRSLGMIREAD